MREVSLITDSVKLDRCISVNYIAGRIRTCGDKTVCANVAWVSYFFHTVGPSNFIFTGYEDVMANRVVFGWIALRNVNG